MGDWSTFSKINKHKIFHCPKKWVLVVEADPDETVEILKQRITPGSFLIKRNLWKAGVIEKQEPFGAERMQRATCTLSRLAIFLGESNSMKFETPLGFSRNELGTQRLSLYPKPSLLKSWMWKFPRVCMMDLLDLNQTVGRKLHPESGQSLTSFCFADLMTLIIFQVLELRSCVAWRRVHT